MSANVVYDLHQIQTHSDFLSLSIQAKRDMEISIGIRVKDNSALRVGYIPLARQSNESIKLSRGINRVEIKEPGTRFFFRSYILSVDVATSKCGLLQELKIVCHQISMVGRYSFEGAGSSPGGGDR